MTVLVCTTLLSAFNNNATTQTQKSIQVASIIGNKSIKSIIEELITYDKDDYYSDQKNKNSNYIKLNGGTASLNGS